MNKIVFTCYFLLLSVFSISQVANRPVFTHADTLRGSNTAERAWWDVLHYDISVKPDYANKSIEGKTTITYKVIKNNGREKMQIDLQEPLIIKKILFNNSQKLNYKREGNVFHVSVPKQVAGSQHKVTIEYEGKPKEAVRPPWDGGWIWAKDSLGRPWMSVTCEGLGASVWYPCKDIMSDEPDNGATLTIIAPKSLVAVGNGRLKSMSTTNELSTYTWEVVNPINTYNIIPYIGKYVGWDDTLVGEKGKLDLSFWALDYDLSRAEKQFTQAKSVIHCMEYWFGPYPFYEDGYKLIQAPHLGMEHQSAVAYGNHFKNGYLGRDLSGSGWGLKWDFIIEHESAHEWFGNSITAKDVADMWIHEGFTSYSETLYTECLFGKEAGNEYNVGVRKAIENKYPVIGYYGVNYSSPSTDMYYKGSNMLQTIRHIIKNDSLWRSILRGLNDTFYHKTVTTQEVENYISRKAGIDFSKVFDQYLRTTDIPELQYYYSGDKMKVYFRWANTVSGFNMPLHLHQSIENVTVYPETNWKEMDMENNNASLFDSAFLKNSYYITVKQTAAPNKN